MVTTSEISFADYQAEWLEYVQADNPSTVELGRRFAHKLLTQWLDVADSQDDLIYCDGSGDGGIAVAFLERGDTGEDEDAAAMGDTWYIVQSKYGKAFQGVNTLLEEGQKVIDTLDGKRNKLSSLAEGLLERLLNFRSQASDQDRIIFVFATVETLDENQRRALEDIKAIGKARLGPLFDVEAVSIETIYRRTI